MNPPILTYIKRAITEFDSIPIERKQILSKIAEYIKSKKEQPTNLIYICTHNSRRSHYGQIWGAVAAHYYHHPEIKTYSGGTEATSFNANAILALQKIGFEFNTHQTDVNPIYEVKFGENLSTSCFSKRYDDKANPSSNFAAIMTCSDADENCPFIVGADVRIATTYDDPKAFDNTPFQDEKYTERCLQIAIETLYAFSLINE